jgi:hypothetical protein
MHSVYLEILCLKPGATKEEVKAAYRSLAKQYHPDINRDDQAHEKFVRINEAYHFLTRVGTTPPKEEIYPAQESAYEQWRAQAKAYARKKARDAQLAQQHLVKRLLQSFKWLAVTIGLFNMALAIDFFLPYESNEQEIIKIIKVFESTRFRKEYRYDEVIFTDFRMKFEPGSVPLDYQSVRVFNTLLFSKPQYVEITLLSGDSVVIEQAYDIYHIFGFFIPLLLLGIFLYFFVFKWLDTRLTVALAVLILFIIQLVVFLTT